MGVNQNDFKVYNDFFNRDLGKSFENVRKKENKKK